MKLEDHDVSWNSPSENHHGSMPLGNGDIGLNVWMEPSGDLCFYIGKTDSWGDDSRLLKVGKVRIKFTPSPVSADGDFSQTLKLKTGEIFISSAAGKSKTGIRIWVDANNPVIGVAVDSNIPLKAEAAIELWRTEHCLLPPQVSDIYRNCPDKDKMQFAEPDTLIENLEDGIGWYHHNEKSDGPAMTMEYQGIADAPSFNDPILHRTFGAVIKAGNATRLDERTLETAISEKQNICIYVLTEHPSSPALWLNSMLKTIREIEKQDYDLRWQAHTKWWNDFWNRSHIYISADDEQDAKAVAAVSRAYNLQRFINACGGRGRYPIKFNGSIFTVPPADAPLDADYRRWGGGYWWQNTRLPYIGMCASGDYDLMQSLFRMYFEDILPVCLHRTRKYFGHDGAYFPECMYHWGAVFSETYGWEAPFELREDPLQTSGWHKWEWVAGLELTFMMQDYYDHTKDEKFLKEMPETQKENINDVCIDMSRQYYQTIKRELPRAKIVVDAFHIIADANKRISELRAIIQKTDKVKLPKILFDKPKEHLKPNDRVALNEINKAYPELFALWGFKEELRRMYKIPNGTLAKITFDSMLKRMRLSEYQSVKYWSKTLIRWQDEILAYFDNFTTNGYTEGVNTKLKTIKRLSYGFRNIDNYIRKAMLSFIPISLLVAHYLT